MLGSLYTTFSPMLSIDQKTKVIKRAVSKYGAKSVSNRVYQLLVDERYTHTSGGVYHNHHDQLAVAACSHGQISKDLIALRTHQVLVDRFWTLRRTESDPTRQLGASRCLQLVYRSVTSH